MDAHQSPSLQVQFKFKTNITEKLTLNTYFPYLQNLYAYANSQQVQNSLFKEQNAKNT